MDKISKKKFIKFQKDHIENADPGITRHFLGFGPDLMAVKVWFEEGAIGVEHKHHHAQVSYVESGEFKVTIDGETQHLKAGDSFYVDPHNLHGAVCIKKGVLIDMFTPCREDFLNGEGYEIK